MAKQSNQYVPVNVGFPNPYSGLEGILPEAYQQGQANAQAYQQAYNNTAGFGVKHPIITGVLGAVLGGPAGALLPLQAKQNQIARQQQVLASYNDYAKQALENQKNQDLIAGPRNAMQVRQQQIDYARQNNLIPQDAPDLYPRSLPPVTDENGNIVNGQPMPNMPFIPTEDQRDITNRYGNAIAQNDISRGINQQQVHSFNFGAGAQQGGGGGPQALQAGVSQSGQSFNPLLGDSALGNYSSALSSVANSALGTGNDRYKFEQEAPKRNAEVIKLLAEGKKEQAQALIAKIQADTERAYRQAQINNLNQPPAGRAPNIIDLMTPEQRAAYAARTASGAGSNENITGINALNGLQKIIYSDKSSPEQKANAATLYNTLAPQVGQPGLESVHNPGGLFGIGASDTYRPAQTQAAPARLPVPSKAKGRLGTTYVTPSGVQVKGLGRGG